MTDYTDVWYSSSDGLKLYARDYRRSSVTGNDGPPVLCMHGLTRNSADFEDICDHLANRYRLIVVDQRGRGRSAYDPQPANYQPAVYVQDMFTLLRHLEISSATLMGTSMGGIMAMMMAAMQPDMVKAMIINDVGPELNPAGLARIQNYVGKSSPVTSWDEAVQQTRDTNGVAFPGFSEQDWMRFARRVYQSDKSGRPVLAYDPAIATPIDDSGGQSLSLDLWPTFRMSLDKPMLLLRGELSDLLAPSCVEKMQQINPAMAFVEIPNVGHAPLLNEAAAVAAIEGFLNSCYGQLPSS